MSPSLFLRFRCCLLGSFEMRPGANGISAYPSMIWSSFTSLGYSSHSIEQMMTGKLRPFGCPMKMTAARSHDTHARV